MNSLLVDKKKDCHLSELLFLQRSHCREINIDWILLKKMYKNSDCEVLPWKYNSLSTQMVKEKC